jgi:hypothetical protein
MMDIFIQNYKDKDAEFPTTHDPLETTILAQAQTTYPPTHTDTTYDTTDTLETTIILAQTRTQKKSAFRHLATKNYAATEIKKRKLPVFQSHINFQTARPQLLPAATLLLHPNF